MTFAAKLHKAVTTNNSLVCVGLDSDLAKLPAHLKNGEAPLFSFNKAIIEATHDLVSAYKPNTAFYESLGAAGIDQLKQTCDYLTSTYPEIPIILDAKRGDIGNTNDGYVTFAFEYLGVDAITLHPYLGQESLAPFLAQADKGLIILCRTSNAGAGEFQDLDIDGQPLYRHVATEVSQKWNDNKNCLLVVGATYPKELAEIREIVGPDMLVLVPGIGAQGGDVEAVMKAGAANGRGLIINSSRGIIYASDGEDFAEAARAETEKLRDTINKLRT
jgi:orotidine-5'-phosphate decarboxylase